MNVEQTQQEIVDDFSFFEDWMDRYQYIIDLGRKLPDFPESAKTEDNRLHGCQSQVWLLVKGEPEHLQFQAISDSSIVCGLIALVLRVYSDRSAAEIVAIEPWFIEKIGLQAHLSPTRSNGLHALMQAICEHARKRLAAHSATN